MGATPNGSIFFLHGDVMLTALIFAIYGGIVSCIHGGNFGGHISKVPAGIFWALPFGLFVQGLAQHEGLVWYIAIFLSTACFLLCLGGKNSGVGNGIDHNTQPDGKPEFLEFLIRPLKTRVDPYTYEALLNIVCGFAAVSGGALGAAVLGYPIAAMAIAAGGMFRAEIYPLCWHAFSNGFHTKHFTQPTQCAELFVGIVALGVLGVVVHTIF